MNKLLLIDKPSGWTSFDVVARIRNEARRVTGDKKIKVGHAGTLDPFATGLLLVLIGKEKTKEQDSYMKQDKEYLATMQLGFTSTTGDPEGEILELSRIIPKLDDIHKALVKFTGELRQIPPIYSAIKIDGERAYKLARAGREVKMSPRVVNIYSLELIRYDYPTLELVVNCSSGTYVRTLAADIGKFIGSGAYLTALRRTKIGDYTIESAGTIDESISNLSVA